MRRRGVARQPCIMTWSMTGDVEEYLAAAGDFLRSWPAENTVVLSVTATLLASGSAPFGEAAPLFGWWQADGEQVAGAFMQTPPLPVVLTRMPAHAVIALADTFATAGRPLPGVNASSQAATAFADAWRERTSAIAEMHTHTRLYRLGQLRSPRPAPPGNARIAAAADRDLVLDWIAAFSREVHSLGGARPDAVDDRLSYGGITLWETGGTPVSLAGITRPVAGMLRVGPVYTPPELRGRGYAGAATAAVSRAALDDGVTEILLFTDLANPTSNALYQRLGYRPVEDRAILTFKKSLVQRASTGYGHNWVRFHHWNAVTELAKSHRDPFSGRALFLPRRGGCGRGRPQSPGSARRSHPAPHPRHRCRGSGTTTARSAPAPACRPGSRTPCQ